MPGVAVFVEKPVAHTLADGIRVCEAAEATGVKVLVGHHRRHSPILHKVAEVVQSGILGQLVGVIGSAVFYKPDSEGYYGRPERLAPRTGGGPILLNLIHEVGNLRAMVGEIVAVQAFTSNATRGFKVEDTAAINFQFANGALGSFLLSDTAGSAKSWEQTSQENKQYPTYPDEDCYTIIGNRGSLAVPTMRLKYYKQGQRPFLVQAVLLQNVARRAQGSAGRTDRPFPPAVIRGEAERAGHRTRRFAEPARDRSGRGSRKDRIGDCHDRAPQRRAATGGGLKRDASWQYPCRAGRNSPYYPGRQVL